MDCLIGWNAWVNVGWNAWANVDGLLGSDVHNWLSKKYDHNSNCLSNKNNNNTLKGVYV